MKKVSFSFLGKRFTAVQASVQLNWKLSRAYFIHEEYIHIHILLLLESTLNKRNYFFLLLFFSVTISLSASRAP